MLLRASLLGAALWIAGAGSADAWAAPARAMGPGDAAIVEAREAHKRGDKARLASLRETVLAAGHPLGAWVDYWWLNARLAQASVAEVDAFFARWSGTYVEDRLRNDWLLELGRRRDWASFSAQYPRFRMNDDREVSCYAVLTRHQAGQDVRQAAREAWFAQRDADDGCGLLARTLFEAGQLGAQDVWQELRLSAEFNRPRAARDAAALLGPEVGQAVAQIFDSPTRWLLHRATGSSAHLKPLRLLAVIRLATSDPEGAATQLGQPWARDWPLEWKAAGWAAASRHAALKLMPEAATWYRRAYELQHASGEAPPWSDETHAWAVRAALRSGLKAEERWGLVLQATKALIGGEREDAAWMYWRARALQSLAANGPAGDAARQEARGLLLSIASPLSFYGKLAAEDLGQPLTLPPNPAPATAAEREAARTRGGLQRALHMIALGLRGEGVREWNFTLRGMSDRELLAAADLACEREVWDRCINTSDRTKGEINLAQRFPTPFRQEVTAAARNIGLDASYVYGLIRQESRFVMDARSHVGASGLMQLMPATARWTAKRIGLDFRPDMITDRDVNLRLGTAYLKLVLDDFGGSMALAAAAYNAGPGRPRRWRDGPALEVAAWAEIIPFNETRDYVKKVLSNTAVYAALLEGRGAAALKVRLGGPIGPREAGAPAPDKELP